MVKRRRNHMKLWAKYAHKNYICHENVVKPDLGLRTFLRLDDHDLEEMRLWIEKTLELSVPKEVAAKWVVVQDVIDFMDHPHMYTTNTQEAQK